MKRLLTMVVLVLPFAFSCDAAKPQPRQGLPEAPPPFVAVEEKVPEPEPETVRVKADIGMTGKGQYNHGGGERPMDIILVPVSQNFLIRERVALQQIQHAEDLYRAGHDNKLPDSHEEYMRDVLMGMPLPKLPDGHKYVYDPKEQQLMIEKPKN